MRRELLKLSTSEDFAYDDGSTAPVTFSTAKGDFRYVRLFGLPIEVDDKHVASALSKYGKIHQLVRERYGAESGYPILNGVRGAHMEMSTAVPSQLRVLHFQVRVFYEGMQTKCFTCGSPEHVKQNCPKRQTVNDRLKQTRNEPTSFARIVQNGAAESNPVPSTSSAFPPLSGMQKLSPIAAKEPVVMDKGMEQPDDNTSSSEMDPPKEDDQGFQTVESRKRTLAKKTSGKSTDDSEISATEAEVGEELAVPESPNLLAEQVRQTRSKSKKSKT